MMCAQETGESGWSLSAWRKPSGSPLFAEHALLQADATTLRQALGLPFNEDEEDPELYYAYPIRTEQQLESVQPFLEHPVAFQPERFDYILECFQGTEMVSTEVYPAEDAPPPVERVLGIYRKAHGDEMIFEYELPPADAELRALLGPPDEQNLFHQRVFRTSWRITTREMAEQLRPYLKAPIDPEGDVDYWVEYHDPKRTRRMLFAYAKGERGQGRSPVAGHELRGMTKRELRKLFGLAEDHPGTGSHPVATQEQAQALARFLDVTPDLEARDYAVEYYGLPVRGRS